MILTSSQKDKRIKIRTEVENQTDTKKETRMDIKEKWTLRKTGDYKELDTQTDRQKDEKKEICKDRQYLSVKQR